MPQTKFWINLKFPHSDWLVYHLYTQPSGKMQVLDKMWSKFFAKMETGMAFSPIPNRILILIWDYMKIISIAVSVTFMLWYKFHDQKQIKEAYFALKF